MVRRFVILVMALVLTALYGQNMDWQWVKNPAGPSGEQGMGVKVDDDGNTYVAGVFHVTITFGSTTLTTSGTRDIYVAKLDNSGNWLWAKKAGGPGDDNCTSIAIDSEGNVFVTGAFDGTCTFGGTNLTSAGSQDIYLAKLDTNGNWQWAVRAGGWNTEYAYSVACDNLGNVFLTGYFYDTAAFGSTNLTSIGNNDIFIAKLDTNGNWLWANKASGSLNEQGYSVACDNTGNVFVAGYFSSTTTFGTTQLSSNNDWDNDIFVAKLDGSGNWLWAVKAGGANYQMCYSVAVDDSGDAYITGSFQYSAVFGAITLPGNGNTCPYAAKIDSSGNWQWAIPVNVTSYSDARSITVDNANNVYVAGYYNGTATFGTHVLNSNSTDIFVAKADSVGNWLWAKRAGGNDYDMAWSVAVNSFGNICITGSYREAASFGYNNLSAGGYNDNVYVAKLTEVTQIPDIASQPLPGNTSVSILPSTILNWNGNINTLGSNIPSGFKIWLGTDNPPTNIVDSLDLGAQLSYNPSSDLELNNTYYWKIVPYNSFGEAQDCPVWSFQTYGYDVLEYPVAGDIWLSGTTRTISWSTVNPPPQVVLYISFDNGSQWYNLATVAGSQGFYYYQVPALNSTLCKIMIASADNQSYFDLSDAFRITTSSTLPKLLLSYPNNIGIHLNVNQSIDINWIRQNVTNVALDLSIDNGVSWIEIITGSDTNTYQWSVPDNPSSNCRIRVRSIANPEIYDISDNVFGIGKVQVISPNGGEVITGDYSDYYNADIMWSAPGVTNVKIEYSPDSGNNWSEITSSTPAVTGSFITSVPGTPTTTGRIRISNADNPAIFDMSDADFSIRNPLKLMNANGGGFVTNTSLFPIRWTNQAVNPAWNIWWEFSTDDTNWTRINNNAVSVLNQEMQWFCITGQANEMLLRAVESNSSRIIGKSENPFVVTDKVLVLQAPDGGENYFALSNQEITWDEFGLNAINIDLSYDDGITWANLAGNVPAWYSYYAWEVPNLPSTTCRVRLTSTEESYMHIESSGSFIIHPFEVVLPTIDFVADNTTGEIPLTVNFTETVNPGSGIISTRLWDFGDGNTSDEENPTHIYEVPGTYTVSLTVTNSFEGVQTYTRTDYITATPHVPMAQLLSSAIMSYGMVNPGQQSHQQIEIMNNGTDTLWINEITFAQPETRFFPHGIIPVPVYAGSSILITVTFAPLTNAAVYDTMRIINNSINQTEIMITLIGNVEVPLSIPENALITINANNAEISWDAVTTTIYGVPATPDRYIILFNETPDNDDYFWYLGSTTGLTYIHQEVALFCTSMFYKVVAVKFYNREQETAYNDLLSRSSKVTWKELKAIIR